MNTFLKDNRSSLIILSICFVVLLLLIVASGKGFSNPFTAPQVGTPMMDVDSSLQEKEIINQANLSISLQGQSSSDDAMSYGDFVQTFGDKRIQFDDMCRATPGSSSFSVGDTLILDNRSNKIQAVKFVDDLYALPPYHVRVFKLERQGIFNIDCGTSRNVAEIIVH